MLFFVAHNVSPGAGVVEGKGEEETGLGTVEVTGVTGSPHASDLITSSVHKVQKPM